MSSSKFTAIFLAEKISQVVQCTLVFDDSNLSEPSDYLDAAMTRRGFSPDPRDDYLDISFNTFLL